jgi:5-methyltetrahydropteroyltriglutamate--homocysteine methyltransferase
VNYATAAVFSFGAYPKPADVPIKDWDRRTDGTDISEPTAGNAETVRQHGAALEAILDAATVEVVREQDALGIDVPTDGEIRRENYIHYHCRHLVGIDFATLTEKRMRGHYQALLPTITGPVRAARQPFLVRDWQIAQSATRKPVKITLPGPLTIGDSVADHEPKRQRRWL